MDRAGATTDIRSCQAESAELCFDEDLERRDSGAHSLVGRTCAWMGALGAATVAAFACAITSANVGRLIEAWRGARRGRDLHPTLVGGEVHREPIAGAKTAHGQGNLGAYGVEFGERLADLA